MQKKVRLALGSGGARGMAHIGVIEALHEHGFEIVEVSGSSMGAIVGGLYCAGHLDAYTKWLKSLSRLDVFKLLDFTFSSQGFVKGEKVFKAIEQLIGDHQIENFKIPFTAVATDLIHRKEIHYKQGSLFKALRASVAIPTIFTPVDDQGTQLVDGGVLNPVPVNVLKKQTEDWVVAVNISAQKPIQQKIQSEVNKQEANKERAAYLRMMDQFRNQILRLDSKAEENVEKLGLFDILNKSYDLTQDRLTDLMFEMHQPELIVEVSRDACGVFEFYRAQEMIDLGKKAFNDALASKHSL
ncbi:MAG: patatin-like phospholipase family protein [Cyclobacteriaceae bacterium]|jgi:NTE family protein|nr:patatin-like phospholipase family protein [Cyclobacteriaceae bacterium]